MCTGAQIPCACAYLPFFAQMSIFIRFQNGESFCLQRHRGDTCDFFFHFLFSFMWKKREKYTRIPSLFFAVSDIPPETPAAVQEAFLPLKRDRSMHRTQNTYYARRVLLAIDSQFINVPYCSVGDLPTRVSLNLLRDLFPARYCYSEEWPLTASCEAVMLGASRRRSLRGTGAARMYCE